MNELQKVNLKKQKIRKKISQKMAQKIFFKYFKKKQKTKKTFGEGTIENELMIRSGNSSRIFETRSVPIPEPVPPPSE